MPQSDVLLTLDAGVAVITLNRPEALNAFAGDMRDVLLERLDEVASSGEARVLVLTGAGGAFCSGGDVKFMHGLVSRGAGYAELEPLVSAGEAIVTRLASFAIPVLAAIPGVAAGAGANLALACDVRLASEQARFSESFVRIGLHLDWGGSYALPRVVGIANALDLCWSGERIGAPDMLRLGLVQRVWPAAEFEREWRAYAANLAAAPRASVRLTRTNLRASAQRTLAQALAAESAAQAACWESGDPAEGIRAFVGKRPPVFGNGAEVRADAPSAASRQFE